MCRVENAGYIKFKLQANIFMWIDTSIKLTNFLVFGINITIKVTMAVRPLCYAVLYYIVQTPSLLKFRLDWFVLKNP
jgi:hypothetical protein